MMQLSQINSAVREGPGLWEESGDPAFDQEFDALLSAITNFAAAEVKVSEADPMDLSTDSKPVESALSKPTNTNSLLDTTVTIEPPIGRRQSDIPNIDPPEPEIIHMEPEAPIPIDHSGDGVTVDAPENQPHLPSFPVPGQRRHHIAPEKLNWMRAERNNTPALPRMDHPPPLMGGPTDVKTEKVEPPIGETPPIIHIPIGSTPRQSSLRRGEGLSFNDVADVARNPPTSVSEGSDFEHDFESARTTDSNDVFDAEATGLSVGEQKTGTFEGKQSLAPEIRNETVGSKILENFNADFDSLIQEAEATQTKEEAVLKQIQKPILEVVESLAKDGEPLLLKFRLKPAELGTVEVKLEQNSEGSIDISIQTDSELATEVLGESFEQLRDSLKEQGYDIDSVDISENKSNSENENRERRSRRDEDAKKFDDSRTTSDVEETEETEADADRLVSIRA